MANNEKKRRSSYSPAVRILSLVLAALVASGILVYLITFILSLFGI